MNRTMRLWAPLAEQSVEVETAGRRVPLQRDGDRGWWNGDSGLQAGDDYRIVLDGGEPLADPRSRFQPEGVHGPSRVVDLDGFPWTDSAWRGRELEDIAAVYELHIGTFTPEGTLDAAIGRLDHLVDLGVGAVELMPVADFPGERGWGYDGVHLWAVHRAYGGPEALCRFVDAAHSRGLAVILDVVYNHLGPDGAVLHHFGPYLTERYTTPWGQALNLDGPDSDGVREFIVENALMWLRDHHLDGVRLDAVHALLDMSAVHILEEVGAAVAGLEAELGRRLHVIAESDLNDPRVVKRVTEGGFGLDAQWSDDFHHALWVALTGERAGYYADYNGLADVATALRRGVVHEGRWAPSRRRRHGRPFTGVPGQRLLGYLQDHDQVGNRAAGERSSALLDVDALRAAAATVLLGPFTPMLFMGEEWGAGSPFQYFTDHEEPKLARAVSRGRRAEFATFGWRPQDVPDPQDPATFERSRLDWSETADEPHASLLAWHRALLDIRQSRPELRRAPWAAAGDGFDGVECEVDEAARTLVMRRGGIVVAWNLGDASARLPPVQSGGVLLTSAPGWQPGDGMLPPGATVVLADAGAELLGRGSPGARPGRSAGR